MVDREYSREIGAAIDDLFSGQGELSNWREHHVALINLAAREINYKIVYYGCGLCGKTTNIQYIHRRVNPSARGRLVSIATEEERTLYFDFLPLSLGTVKGLRTRFHLYTVPGQSFYNASRKLVLQGIDGVVFVADSQVSRAGRERRQLPEPLGQPARPGRGSEPTWASCCR